MANEQLELDVHSRFADYQVEPDEQREEEFEPGSARFEQEEEEDIFAVFNENANKLNGEGEEEEGKEEKEEGEEEKEEGEKEENEADEEEEADEEAEDEEDEEDVEEDVEEEDEKNEKGAEEEESLLSPDERARLLALQNTQLQEELARIKAEANTKVEDKKEDDPTIIDPKTLPTYNYEIPREYLEALTSDDAAQNIQAITGLFNGFAAIAHQRVMNEVNQKLEKEVISAIPDRVRQVQNSDRQIQDIRKDYYSNNPKHDDPSIHPIVARATQMVLTSYQNLGNTNPPWNAEMRELVAKTTEQLSGISGKAASVKAKGKTKQDASKKKPASGRKTPPKIRSSSARKTGGKSQKGFDIADEINEIFS